MQVPGISWRAKLWADGAGVAWRSDVLALNVKGHGMFVSGGVIAVSAPKPSASWLKVRKREYSFLYFLPEGA